MAVSRRSTPISFDGDIACWRTNRRKSDEDQSEATGCSSRANRDWRHGHRLLPADRTAAGMSARRRLKRARRTTARAARGTAGDGVFGGVPITHNRSAETCRRRTRAVRAGPDRKNVADANKTICSLKKKKFTRFTGFLNARDLPRGSKRAGLDRSSGWENAKTVTTSTRQLDTGRGMIRKKITDQEGHAGLDSGSHTTGRRDRGGGWSTVSVCARALLCDTGAAATAAAFKAAAPRTRPLTQRPFVRSTALHLYRHNAFSRLHGWTSVRPSVSDVPCSPIGLCAYTRRVRSIQCVPA